MKALLATLLLSCACFAQADNPEFQKKVAETAASLKPVEVKKPVEPKKPKEQFTFVPVTVGEVAQREEIEAGAKKDVAEARKIIRELSKMKEKMDAKIRRLDELNRRVATVQKVIAPATSE